MIHIDLSGKNVLITGALGTIGSAMVTRFADAGANVIAADMPGAAGAEEQVSMLARGASYFGCDLNDLDGTEKATRDLSEEVGGIDILVNNAAFVIRKPLDEFTIAEYEQQVRVNASAPFVMSRAVSLKMREKGGGKIIIVTSATLNGNWDQFVPYITSKGGTLGLVKALARDLGPFGINVNGVCPGSVQSEAEKRNFLETYEEYQKWIMERQSVKKRIQPTDIANMAVMLSSPLADLVSGQNVWVDGGW